MVTPRAYQSDTNRDRFLAGHLVRLQIADVVDVEHGHRQKAASGRRQHDRPVELSGLDEITAHHADPAEENQHRYIAQAGIAVRYFPGCVSNRRPDGGRTYEYEYKGKRERFTPKSNPQQGNAGDHGQQGRNNDRATHPGRSHLTALHGSLRPLTLNMVRPMGGVAIIVGKIGKNLQQDGREDG